MLADHKGEVPFIVYILPFLAGIWLAMSFGLADHMIAVSIAFGILLGTFIALNLLYERTKLYRLPWVGGTMMHTLLLLAGTLITLNHDDRNHSNFFAKHPADQLLVRINSEPQLKGQFLRFTAVVDEAITPKHRRHTTGNLLVTMTVDSARARKFAYGDVLLIPAKYDIPDAPFNPAEFNYRKYLSQKNVFFQSFTDLKHVFVVDRKAGNQLVAYSLGLRQRLVGQFKKYMQDPEAIAVASTLILGYKAELDNDILQAYSKTGTIHVLSVSGAHVAIIFMMIAWLLKPLDRWRWGKYLKATLSIGLIWYYSLLTGLSPAVCRAAVMITMVILGTSFTRRISMVNILAASAMAILLYDPFLIMDVGFQLSYLALVGLLVFQPIVYGWWDVENKWLDRLWIICSASIAIQAITFPLSAYYFHQFPVYFLISNLLIIIPVEVVMYAGIGCLIASQAGWVTIAEWTGQLLQKSILLMDAGLRYIERSPYSSVTKIWLNGWELWLMVAFIVLLFAVFYYQRAVLLKVSLVCLFLLCISSSFRKIRSVRTDSISYLNLKKHSGIVFKQGTRAVVLTDLADTDKTFKYSIRLGLDSSRVEDVVILPFSKDTSTMFFKKQANWVRFVNKDMVIIDKYLWLPKRGVKSKADQLFVTGSPHIAPGSIDANFSYGKLIVDAGNSDKATNAIKAGLKDDKKMYALKRNRALVIQSNQ
ncbi:ComEC/Rec2 family competence protein [Mucilaginibacter myungsuensis]|uniref:ComEC family competence protein n=1 Tax=Mucilaginibacter myungsuensis TaxID=649104 RepID=A0A929PVK0_9SPHI|nr:ComEC/Rec2 family competence protein [Mucilaginibacter myungsuensis]MBE9661863.1 ComEC family competence protein [Mucilaginibacter myungsuensis]MDN3599703.1 ComEC/Rec2 family competence protein [Mucilaginibacter myungsuensis]